MLQGTPRHHAAPYVDGVAKEKMQRQYGIRAVMEVGEGVHKRRIDTEEFHDDDNVGVDRFIRRQLEEAESQMNQGDPTTGLSGTATGSDGKVGGIHDGPPGEADPP